MRAGRGVPPPDGVIVAKIATIGVAVVVILVVRVNVDVATGTGVLIRVATVGVTVAVAVGLSGVWVSVGNIKGKGVVGTGEIFAQLSPGITTTVLFLASSLGVPNIGAINGLAPKIWPKMPASPIFFMKLPPQSAALKLKHNNIKVPIK